jgi:hypothetical protein
LALDGGGGLEVASQVADMAVYVGQAVDVGFVGGIDGRLPGGGLFFVAHILLSPTKEKLTGSYAFVGLTLATGTALVVLKPQHITTTCVEGLVYVGLMLTGITFIKQKISAAKLID